MIRTRTPLLAALLAAVALPASAAEEVNVYSARHYDSDDALYEAFEAATGIAVNRVEAKADELIERIKAEGSNSPADVLITVDAGRLWRAEEAGLFAPFESAAIAAAVPDHLRQNSNLWTAFAKRARMIFYAKDRVETPPASYAELADPMWKGKICIRSSTNVYNQSLLASIIEHQGDAAAKAWAEGVVANMARSPQGGDTDQLRGIVSGECDVAVANSYYFARGFASEVRGLSDGIEGIGWVFPDQEGAGAHVNVSGVGVMKNAPHPANAVKFMEFLLTPEAQEILVSGSNEFPVVEGVAPTAAVQKLGAFKADALDLTELGAHQAEAVRVFDAVGWK